MRGTHGHLISEIGKLVVAAHAGEPIDLTATSQELACRYAHLGVPPDGMARAIARSLGAVGVCMAVVKAAGEAARRESTDPVEQGDSAEDAMSIEQRAKAAAALFPSGLRLTPVS